MKYGIDVNKLWPVEDILIDAYSTFEAANKFVKMLGPSEGLQALYGEAGEKWDWSVFTEDFG